MYCTRRRLERPVADRDAGHQRRDQQECCVITRRQVDDAAAETQGILWTKAPGPSRATQAPANWIAIVTGAIMRAKKTTIGQDARKSHRAIPGSPDGNIDK
jgi:hypothetical protein